MGRLRIIHAECPLQPSRMRATYPLLPTFGRGDRGLTAVILQEQSAGTSSRGKLVPFRSLAAQRDDVAFR